MSASRPRPRRVRRPGRRASPPGRTRLRLGASAAVFGLAFGAITFRLVDIQAVHAAAYQRMARVQDERTTVLPALRGSLLAANGDELALSELQPTIFADPGEVTQVGAEAAALAPVLRQPAGALRRRLGARTTYVVLAPDTTAGVAAAVTKLGLAGIGVEHLPVRYHPDGSLAAPLLGTLDGAGAGNSGLELQYNRDLTGRPGELVQAVDPLGGPVPGGVVRRVPAVPGDDLLTTIDPPLQYQAERALAQDLRTTKGASGEALVMDRRTGDLLAVAQMVRGRHGVISQAPTATALTSVYEPGSVAKLITMAGALTDHVISPRQVFDIPPALLVDGTYIHDDSPHPAEQLSVTGILAQSSNIGAAEVGLKLGARSLYHWERAFGYGVVPALGFPGESAGLVPRPAQFSGTTLATMAYGEAQAVTPLQVLDTYNTLANGGVYVPPRLVTATVGPHGGEHPLAAQRPHRVIPARVARELAPMFEQVVSSGTGVAAQIPGYAVAGKTGTSNILMANGQYSPNLTNSTFVGFYPAQDPAITELVVVHGSVLFGAEAAAPTFSIIAKDTVTDLGIASAGPQPKPRLTSVPVVAGQPETSLLGQ